MAEEGVVAGRLEIPVESDTKGFGERLRAAIDKEARNITAKIGVEWDEDGLRKKLEAAVDAAAKGVKAHIDVDVDTKKAKAQLEKLHAKVNVKVEGLTDDVRRESWLARLFAKKNPIEYPVKAERKGFFSSLLSMQVTAQAAANKKPIKIPFAPDSGAGARSAFMPLFLLAIGSIIQPAIAAIVGSLGGVVAMIGNLGAAVQTLAAAPGLLGAVVGGFLAVTLAVKALQGPLDKLPKPLRDIRKEFSGLSDDWKALQKGTALAFWKELKGDIKSTGEKLLPMLDRAMQSFGTTMGKTTSNLLAWMRTPLFTGQFKTITASSNQVLGDMGTALIGVAKGLSQIAYAATLSVGGKDSLMERLGHAFSRMGNWAANIAAPGKAANDFAEELGYAMDKASQLWEILKDLGAGIKGIFLAGRESGDRLLGTLVNVVNHWRHWVESDMGQQKIKDWFDAVEPITREAGKLIVGIGQAIGRLAKDPNVANMLRTIRVELLPTLEKFLNNLGKSLGPEVIDFFTNLLSVLTEMSEAGAPLATGLGYINKALSGLSDWLRANPAIAEKLGVILGGLLAFRALAFIGNISGIPTMLASLSKLLKGGGLMGIAGLTAMILPFTGALGDMNPALQGAVSAFGAFLTLRSTLPAMQGILKGLSGAFDGVRLQAMYAADNYRAAAAKFQGAGASGFGAAARAVGTTARMGLRGALGALAVGLGTGGVVGLAIAGASTAVGIWAAKHAEAAQKAQEYKGFVDEIVASLDKETGALTTATRATIAKKLQDNGAADAAAKYGINLGDLTSAAMGNADSQSRVGKALRTSIALTATATDKTGLFRLAMKDAGVTQGQLESALFNGGNELAVVTAKLDGAAHGNVAMQSAINKAITAGVSQTKGQRDLHNQVVTTTKAIGDAAARQDQFNKLMDKAGGEVRDVTSALAALPPGKNTTVKALTKDAEARLRDLGYTVKRLPDGSVTVSASTAAAERAINYAARNRTAHIQVAYSGQGRNLGGGLTQANGGIVQFANGGITGLLDKARAGVQAFANGTENHIAQIAKAGTWRLWAEPETGGEAYIPLGESKRKRSMEILAEVADRFGMVLAPKFNSLAQAMEGRGDSLQRVVAFANGGGLRSSDLSRAASAGPSIVFEEGAVQITNPVPETASESVANTTRKVSALGLFGDA